jgi:hypothetical protein
MNMSDWLHNLPVVWMALVVFGFTYLVAAAIYAFVTVLAVDERARSFKAISAGMLPPLGIIFGLFVATLMTGPSRERSRLGLTRCCRSCRRQNLEPISKLPTAVDPI